MPDETITSVSKGGYNKLLRQLEESLAANLQLQERIQERNGKISELEMLATASEIDSASASEQPSTIEKILLFFEHGLFLTAVGIGGPLMVPLSNWFLLLPAGCFALAFHRVGVVRGRPWFQQVPSYLLIAVIGIATGFGIHAAIEKQENELLSRIATLLPKPKPSPVPVPPVSVAPVPPTKSFSPTSTIRPYDLPDAQRNELVNLLAAPPAAANVLRIGCVPWSDRACAGAGKFLVVLSQAGWKIDENKVFRVDNAIPTEGISITDRPESGFPHAPQPPHLGRWHKMNLTDITFMTALTAMGLKYNGSSDESLFFIGKRPNTRTKSML